MTWQRLLRSRLELTTRARRLAQEALNASGRHAGDRLRAMRDFSARCEVAFAPLLEERMPR